MGSKRATLLEFPELILPQREKMRQKCGQDCDECAKNARGEIPKQAVLTRCFLYQELEKKIDHQKKPLVVKYKDTADTNNLHGCKKLPGKKVRKRKRVTCGQRHRVSIVWGSLTSRITDTESMESFLEKDCYLLTLFYAPKLSIWLNKPSHLHGAYSHHLGGIVLMQALNELKIAGHKRNIMQTDPCSCLHKLCE